MSLMVWAMLSASPSLAQQATTSPPTLSADLRSEYLAGESLLVQLQARNETGEPVSVPDLAARHDLVRFELKMPTGATDNRRSLVEAPSERTWQIPPRGVREALLELPASSTLRPGEYQLAIHVQLAEGDERTLAPHTLRLAAPAPVEVDLSAAAQPSERGSDLVPWVHKARDGYDLYLHHASSAAPDQVRSQDFLARLPAQADPMLTVARSAESRSRYIVWLEEGRRVSYAEIQGSQLRNAVQTVSVPWPRVELAARGVTSPSGHLYQPLWIPAPRGDAGELRLMTTTTRDVAYRRAARLDARPRILETVIDDGGSTHLVAVTGGAVDLYTVRADSDPARAAKENLPLSGKRLLVIEDGQPIQAVRFGILSAGEDYPGGLAMMLLQQTAPGQLTPRWLTFSGEPIRTAAPITVPEGASLVDAVPAASGDVGVLVRVSDRQHHYIEAGQYQRLSGLPGELALDRTDSGAPYLRTAGKPVAARMLTPDTPVPLPEPLVTP